MLNTRRLFFLSLALYGAALFLPAYRIEPLFQGGDDTVVGFHALVKTVMACFWDSHFAAFFAANLFYALSLRNLWIGDVLTAFGLSMTSFMVAAAALFAFALDFNCLSFEVGMYAWMAALVLPGLAVPFLSVTPRRLGRRPLPTFD